MSHQVRRTAWSLFWFLIGLVCTGVGVGLGIPHAAKSGVSGGTILGLALILLGLTAFGYGVLGLLRSTRRRWWLLTGPAMLLAAYVGLSSVAQPVAATHVPPTPLSGRTPASLGLPYEAVSFDTTDGVSLAGWYLPSQNGAAVALLHGSGGNRTSVLDHAAVLFLHGYGVLLFDARGHGLSGGTAMDFGWYGETDTRAATTYLLGRPDVAEGRVGAVGLSMGGEEAIGAAGVDRRVRAVVAEGATNRVFGDKGWLVRYGLRG